MNDLMNQVCGIAADVFQVDPSRLSAQSSPETVEAWDSVQHLNLVLALETNFGLQFEPEEMDRMNSIGQIAALLENKIA